MNTKEMLKKKDLLTFVPLDEADCRQHSLAPHARDQEVR